MKWRIASPANKVAPGESEISQPDRRNDGLAGDARIIKIQLSSFLKELSWILAFAKSGRDISGALEGMPMAKVEGLPTVTVPSLLSAKHASGPIPNSSLSLYHLP